MIRDRQPIKKIKWLIQSTQLQFQETWEKTQN